MKESEAWREVARRIDAGKWDKQGICIEASNLYCDDLISEETEDDMWSRVRYQMGLSPEDWSGYAYPPGTQRKARILAALFLALEAESEGK